MRNRGVHNVSTYRPYKNLIYMYSLNHVFNRFTLGNLSRNLFNAFTLI